MYAVYTYIYPALVMKGLNTGCSSHVKGTGVLFQNDVRTNQEAVRGVLTSQREEPVARETTTGRNR